MSSLSARISMGLATVGMDVTLPRGPHPSSFNRVERKRRTQESEVPHPFQTTPLKLGDTWTATATPKRDRRIETNEWRRILVERAL